MYNHVDDDHHFPQRRSSGGGSEAYPRVQQRPPPAPAPQPLLPRSDASQQPHRVAPIRRSYFNELIPTSRPSSSSMFNVVDPSDYRGFCLRGEGRNNIVISAKSATDGLRFVNSPKTI